MRPLQNLISYTSQSPIAGARTAIGGNENQVGTVLLSKTEDFNGSIALGNYCTRPHTPADWRSRAALSKYALKGSSG